VSVSLSVCHNPVLYQNSWTDEFAFGIQSSFDLFCIQLSPKVRVLPSRICPKLWTKKYFCHVTSATASVGNSREVSTDNCCLFIILSDYIVFETNRTPAIFSNNFNNYWPVLTIFDTQNLQGLPTANMCSVGWKFWRNMVLAVVNSIATILHCELKML